VVRTLSRNTALAQKALAQLVAGMDTWEGDFAAHHALQGALITDLEAIPAETKEKLALLVDGYL